MDLPAPLGPTRATASPAPSPSERCAGARTPRPSASTETSSSVNRAPARSVVATPRAGTGSSSTSNAAFAAAIPSVDAWNWAPTWRSGRYTSGARTSTVSPVTRSRRPSTRRSPMATATIATERVVRSSRTMPDRKAIRSVPIVARRFASPSARTRSRGPSARPNARSVGRPATRSRSWEPSRCKDASRRSATPCVSRPTSTMNSGTSGRVTRTTSPDTQSSPKTTTTRSGVTTAVRRSCGT